MVALLIQPMASRLVKSFIGKRVTRAGRVVIIAGRGYKNMDHMEKIF